MRKVKAEPNPSTSARRKCEAPRTRTRLFGDDGAGLLVCCEGGLLAAIGKPLVFMSELRRPGDRSRRCSDAPVLVRLGGSRHRRVPGGARARTSGLGLRGQAQLITTAARFSLMMLLKIADGKIIEKRAHFDRVDIRRQLEGHA